MYNSNLIGYRTTISTHRKILIEVKYIAFFTKVDAMIRPILLQSDKPRSIFVCIKIANDEERQKQRHCGETIFRARLKMYSIHSSRNQSSDSDPVLCHPSTKVEARRVMVAIVLTSVGIFYACSGYASRSHLVFRSGTLTSALKS